ncbi:hypothetical protein [Methanoplanus endosymbiosus]|uniref:RNA methyltransferase n=1 Tax=Methanoplanus endosymbiosus TaxID=33865 RepID=A0A9E7PN75_9EURY|nr:hypothetical protein [Methanoplanus endosymbiosus]UUX91991.1 hypothetical protein L6E24_11575 [Methanoplanus endosymbiosus]
MATYKQIMGWVKKNYGISVKTCWIANIKEDVGLKLRKAPNRIDSNKRKYSCPPEKRDLIIEAFRHFRMI